MISKDTIFSPKVTIRCTDGIMDFSTPRVMGILNVTDDSFYEGSRFRDEKSLLVMAEKMLMEGADILDVGACSSRPGATEIPALEERERLKMALKALRKEHMDCCISVDTYRAEIAEFAVTEFGVCMINDISAGTADENMLPTAGRLDVAYIMMHMQGNPQTMQVKPHYEDIVRELIAFFALRIETARKCGIKDIIIDPGFGFGKTIQHNFELLRDLELFRILEVPVMVGLSRKSMIYKPLDLAPEMALNGTSVANTLALHNGARLLRVHDVKEAVQAVKLFTIYNRAGK